MKISDAVKALSSALAEIDPHLPTLESIDEQHGLAKAELQATQEKLAKTNTELETAEADFDKLKARSLAEIETARQGKARELKDLQAKIEEAKATHAELLAKVNEKSAHHSQIEASLASLKKQILG